MYNFILQALFQSAQRLYEEREGSRFSSLNTFLRKGKDPKPESDPYLSDSWIRKAQKHADPDPQHWFRERKKTVWPELTGVVFDREETKTNGASSEPFLPPSALPPSPKKRGPGFKVSRVGFLKVEKCKKLGQNWLR
jgi:hypothetical protein